MRQLPRELPVEGVGPGKVEERTGLMRTNRNEYYNAILVVGRQNAPSMKEARRDLDRAFLAVSAGVIA